MKHNNGYLVLVRYTQVFNYAMDIPMKDSKGVERESTIPMEKTVTRKVILIYNLKDLVIRGRHNKISWRVLYIPDKPVLSIEDKRSIKKRLVKYCLIPTSTIARVMASRFVKRMEQEKDVVLLSCTVYNAMDEIYRKEALNE